MMPLKLVDTKVTDESGEITRLDEGLSISCVSRIIFAGRHNQLMLT